LKRFEEEIYENSLEIQNELYMIEKEFIKIRHDFCIND